MVEDSRGPADGPRRRDAGATREAILISAVEAFTRAGYDGAGVREVAGNAGVTAMLVNRYFGSKEQLFAEAVDRSFAPRTVVGDDPDALSEQTANAVARRTAPYADDLDPFLLMLRSAANPRAAEIIRAGIERHVGRHLTGLLSGTDAAARAELLLSLIAGVWLMRKVVATPALAGMDEEALAVRLRELMRMLADPPPDGAGP
ncbi:TetR/AcrR family transcriptional regulator [Microbispora sp. ATCC PTA-5024]|uniref:TetR/AcrR family transcriptional regulator n=1 Tax=Microbispora sp. ATCC PTA-5024 TaxID=316330 RepID=UPI0003DD1B03|nr:TetR/AcrR family transcriptional regulator [Microbispora sp. ATCC PTA-5024]ETK36005.1 TetR family transcriptional regulator [Microbispora sp. ATCC PTA-5024]